MFCSVIIPTIGRDTLKRAVASVVDQNFVADEIEIIVVNDSGQPLPKTDWQQLPEVCMITTNRRERCIARNAGAALAKGKYLCFLDDDDWLLPGALNEFWELAQRQPQAVWLYGSIQIVNEAGTVLAEVNSGLNGNCLAHFVGGAWAPIQASMMQTQTFFAIGGFDPSIIGTEDLDLCRKYAFLGDFANTPAAIASLFRGPTWNTSTDYLRAPADTLRSRENILAQSGAFTRMIASANSSYWYGRILRVYLSTVRFNLRQKKLFTAASRAIFSLMSFALAGRHSLTRDFWHAVKADHPPGTLHFIIKEMEQEAQNNLGSEVNLVPSTRR